MENRKKVKKKFIHVVCLIIVSVSLLFNAQNVLAQNTKFKFFNEKNLRPSPPTNLRIISDDGVPVKLSYQNILDELSSDKYEIREKAAIKLFEERDKHFSSIDLLMSVFKNDSELVTQYVSSVIVDIVNSRPSASRSLKGYFKDFHTTFNSSNDPFSRANCIALMSWATDDFENIRKPIISSIKEGRLYDFTNAVISVNHFAPKSIEVYKTLSDQIGIQKQDMKIIAEAMANIALKFRNNNEIYWL